MGTTPAGRASHRQQADQAHARLVQRLIDEVCSAGHLDRLDAFLAPQAAMPGSRGAASITQALRLFRAAVPDARWSIQEQVAAKGTVVTRLQIQGTQLSGLWGIAPTGRTATVTVVLCCRFSRGRIAAWWAQADLLSLLCQLGVLPVMDLARVVAVAQVLQAGEAWAAPLLEVRGTPRTGQDAREQDPRHTAG